MKNPAGAFAVSLALALGSLSPAHANGDGPALAGTTWIWDELPASPANGAGLDAETAEIRFGDGRVEVFLGCNTATGAYLRRAGDMIAITLEGKTKMLCADLLYEERFYALLEKAARMTLSEDALILYDQADAVLTRLTPK